MKPSVAVPMNFSPVYSKAVKRGGKVVCEAKPSEYEYATKTIGGVKHLAIRRKLHTGEYSKPKVFKVGDTASYDSYNLIYTGKIVSIGEKTVTILPEYSTRKRRLNLYEFSWRNWDFDRKRVADYNAEEMQYI